MKKLAAIVSVVTFAFVLAFALVGCSSGSLGVESDETGVHAVAEGTAEGEGNGNLTVGEGYGIAINHIVNKGSFHVKITDKAGQVVFDEDLTDNIMDTVDAQGEFDVIVSAANAEGTVDIIPYDKEAQAQADKSLDEAMNAATGESAK